MLICSLIRCLYKQPTFYFNIFQSIFTHLSIAIQFAKSGSFIHTQKCDKQRASLPFIHSHRNAIYLRMKKTYYSIPSVAPRNTSTSELHFPLLLFLTALRDSVNKYNDLNKLKLDMFSRADMGAFTVCMDCLIHLHLNSARSPWVGQIKT